MRDCKCVSYNQPQDWQTDESVILDPNPYFPEVAEPIKSLCIDSCIAEEIQNLWRAGIWTLNSCCGHRNEPPAVILGEGEDPAKAREVLGPEWQIMQWQLVACG